MSNTFTRPELSSKGQALVNESVTSFKKRNIGFQIWMIGQMMREFKKLVNEVNSQRLARSISIIGKDPEFTQTCDDIETAIEMRELVKAARMILTENTRMIEECNQHRQVMGVRSKLARASAEG